MIQTLENRLVLGYSGPFFKEHCLDHIRIDSPVPDAPSSIGSCFQVFSLPPIPSSLLDRPGLFFTFGTGEQRNLHSRSFGRLNLLLFLLFGHSLARESLTAPKALQKVPNLGHFSRLFKSPCWGYSHPPQCHLEGPYCLLGGSS
jgi:hypothetical protein